MKGRVLLVDDDRAVRDALGQSLELADLTPVPAGSFVEAKDYITPSFDGVIVSDIRMPGRDGFHLLDHARGVDPELPVILLTGEGDIPMAVRGMSTGAFDFLEKPCATEALLSVIGKALKTRALVLENRQLRAEMQAGDAAARMIVGYSAAADGLRARVRAVAKSGADVLVSGEPGTGTARIAEVVHALSGVGSAPFVKITAATQSADSLGQAMTEAAGGTLFIDEVAALLPEAQFAALALLEENAQTRVIAGTYRDLEAEAHAGRFNPDLYYRLDVMRVRVPPLRERTEDIPRMFRGYVQAACDRAGLPMPLIPDEVLAGLMARDWPGNTRALMNAALRFALGEADPSTAEDLGLADQMARIERMLLIEALQRHDGNATETARALKLPRKTFYDKLSRHALRPEVYRRAPTSKAE